MVFLIANVVYHSLQILRAEIHHAISGLPIQQLPICKFVVDVIRTRAFQFSNPIANQQSGRYRNGDMNVSFSWQARLHVPNEMQVDLRVGAPGHC